MEVMSNDEFAWEYKGRMLHLHRDEICYFHSEGRKTYIHTTKHTYELRGNLGDAERKVRRLPMVRTHKSFLIHLKNLENLTGSEAIMKNGERLPVSAKRRKAAFDTARVYFFPEENKKDNEHS